MDTTTKKEYKELCAHLKGRGTESWPMVHREFGEAAPLSLIEEMMSPSLKMFSVLVYQEIPDESSFRSKNNFKKSNKREDSPLIQALRRWFFKNNNELNRELESLVNKKYGIGRENSKYYTYIDKEYALLRDTKIKELLPQLMREEAFDYIENRVPSLKKRIQNDALPDSEIALILDNYMKSRPQWTKKLRSKLTKTTSYVKYSRKYSNQLPRNLSRLISDYCWSQFYFYRDSKGTLFYAKGSTMSSGLRKSHGYFGHLFSQLRQFDKPIKTFLISFDKKCKLKIRHKDDLVLCGHELTGNYEINKTTSEELLKHAKITYP